MRAYWNSRYQPIACHVLSFRELRLAVDYLEGSLSVATWDDSAWIGSTASCTIYRSVQLSYPQSSGSYDTRDVSVWRQCHPKGSSSNVAWVTPATRVRSTRLEEPRQQKRDNPAVSIHDHGWEVGWELLRPVWWRPGRLQLDGDRVGDFGGSRVPTSLEPTTASISATGVRFRSRLTGLLTATERRRYLFRVDSVLVSALLGRTRPEEWTRQTAQVAARVDGSRLEVRQTDQESDVTTVEGARDDDRRVAWDRSQSVGYTSRSVASRSVHQPCLSDCAGRWLQCSALWWRHSSLWSIRVHCDVTRVHCRQRPARCDRHGWRSLRLVSAPVFGPGRDAIVN